MHDAVGTVVHLEKLQQEGEVGFFAVEEDAGVFAVGVDFSDHQFKKIGVVSSVFFFAEIVFLLDELLLVDFDQEVHEFFLGFEGLEEELQQ